MEILKQVRVILVETSHPGNIGGVARALKTMGLSRLTLVNPAEFPSPVASAMASGADDVLARAGICQTLDEALADARWVIGASARLRREDWPVVDPRTCMQTSMEQVDRGEVALVLGREDSGLTNDELARCHQLVHIPANPEYSSLNLASAVQVLCYEVRQAALKRDTIALSQVEKQEEAPAPAGELAVYYERLEKVLLEIGFLHPPGTKKLMRRLRRLYNRAQPNQTELHILHGILSAALGRKYQWQSQEKDLGNQ